MEIKDHNTLFLFFVSLFFTSQGESVFTVKGFHLIGYELESVASTDWIGCIQKCSGNPDCISYNFNTRGSFCQLNNRGIDHFSYIANEILTQDQDYVFQQLKTPKDHQLARPRSSQCDCNCGSDRHCYVKPPPGIGDTKDIPATACKVILDKRNNAKNGPYYLATFPMTTYVYCHMTELPGCGGGGWTLVMKIDGTKPTFRYNSSFWTSTSRTLNIKDGKDMSEKETLLPTYWGIKIVKQICLGMKYDGLTRWVSLNYTGNSSLYDAMKTHHTTNLNVSQWKKLLPNSSLETICTKQGFNVHDSNSGSPLSRARIGILGYSKSDCGRSFTHSRLGFGTAGSSGGMVDANSCGNEARQHGDNGDRSITAFGYIFVK
ncbi:uncharacterized protein LOC110246788 [Exaiptasia diaphana]|uniref:Apple domain-containing protein n=1 Tax=Exaiptasia diaphana TaxID=2652724 RepID=A0A913XT78_EXADI|nr:uncharacterized protein LOC110246788 [Exaiptasia diaphana]KXJ24964.1 putative skeletal organic matrix protein 5 [Exaiptasia diaphana]